MGRHVVRTFQNRLAAALYGRRQVHLQLLRRLEVVLGERVLGAQAHGPTVGGDRVIEPPQPFECDPQIGVRTDVLRGESHGLLETAECLAGPPQLIEHETEVLNGGRVLLVEGHGAPKRTLRSRQVALAGKADAEVVVCVTVVGVLGDRKSETGDRVIHLAQPVLQGPQPAMAVGVIRIQGDGRLIGFGCLLEPPLDPSRSRCDRR